MASFHRAI